MIYNWRFGSDPELFLTKANNGYAHSAHLLREFDTLNAKVRFTEGRSYLKKDGFAIELNSDGTSCRDWHMPNTAAVLRKFLKEYKDYDLSAKPMLKLTQESLRNAPDEVMGYGCVPDMDAYEIEEKSPPTSGYHDDNRYIGGHLHYSLIDKTDQNVRRLLAAATAIALDVHLGIPLVAILGHSNDYGEAARRRYYGAAGSYRQKEYGLEYRVPSGAIMLSPILYSWAIGQGRHTLQQIRFGKGNELYRDFTENDIIEGVKASAKRYDFERVRRIINTHDVEDARAFVEEHELLKATIGNNYKPPIYQTDFYRLMVDADKNGIGFSEDMVANWQLRTRMPFVNHGYIGVERAMNGKWGIDKAMPEPADYFGDGPVNYIIRDNIFPQYELLSASRPTGWSL